MLVSSLGWLKNGLKKGVDGADFLWLRGLRSFVRRAFQSGEQSFAVAWDDHLKLIFDKGVVVVTHSRQRLDLEHIDQALAAFTLVGKELGVI
jgi:hypothetical protein